MVVRRDPMKDHETFIKALDQICAIGILPGKGTDELPNQPIYDALACGKISNEFTPLVI